jgi:hypothetical protein
MNNRSQIERSYVISAFLVFSILIFLVGFAVGGIPIEELFYPTLNLGHELAIDTNSMESCISPPCHNVEYKVDGSDPGTIVWRYPGDNNGESNGRDLTGVRKLTFYARSSSPMTVLFTVGAFPTDSAKIYKSINLGDERTQYTIELSNEDLRNIRGGFACTLNSKGIVYLDNINYER